MSNNRVILKGGHVIDVLSGEVLKDSILVIENGRFTHLGRAEDYQCDTFARQEQIFDVTNQWIIPGFIDMHVHIKEAFAPYFVSAGVTTVRNTGGNVLELQDLISATASAPTPRIISADRVIDGPPGLWGDTSPWSFVTVEPREARQEVQRQIKAGADFVKVYGLLSAEVMEAVIEEAHASGKEVSCDLIHQTQVDALTAANLGIDWIEHASGFIQALYPFWSMKGEEEVWERIDWRNPPFAAIEELCQQLIEKGVKICPTMVLYDQIERFPEYWHPDHFLMDTIAKKNPDLYGQWKQYEAHLDKLKLTGVQSIFNKTITKIYADLGGTVVAGTDSPAGIWTFPGLSLHREMEIFVEIGFSELEALQAATCRSAKALKIPDIGVVQEGAIADAVILNANPLENIKNTKEISSVIKGGRVYSQEEIVRFVPSQERIAAARRLFIDQFNRVIS